MIAIFIPNNVVMQQIVFIHGGMLSKGPEELMEVMRHWEIDLFTPKQRWRDTLPGEFPDRTVIMPQMPAKELAHYGLWKLWFEKHIPFFDPEQLIVIGHSLGAMFLLKYLSEEQFSLPIAQLHLIAPVCDAEGLPEGDNYLGDFAYELENIAKITDCADTVHVWVSRDDAVVPYTHGLRIHAQLLGSELHVFEDR